MREIKFRGKRISDGRWVYGYYVFQRARTGVFGQQITEADADRHLICHPKRSFFEVEPETIGQYTGLKDKNGKEVYEGDVCQLINTMGWPGCGEVQHIDGCFDIVFEEALWDPAIKACRERDYLKCWTVNNTIKVIGNIHDQKAEVEG